MSAVSYIQKLREQLKEQKQWANKKFAQAAQRLVYNLLQLMLLKFERFNRETTTFKDNKRFQDECLDKQIRKKNDILKKVNVQLRRV